MGSNCENTVVYPPNITVQRKVELSTQPVIYDHLLFLDFNENSEAILGSSNLNGTLWEGTLLYFDSEQDLELLKYSRTLIGSTVSDGKFLNSNTFVLAEDSGLLNIISIPPDNSLLNSKIYFRLIDRISKIAVWKNGAKIITAAGNSVGVFDVNSTIRRPFHYFEDYHIALVNDVATVKNESNCFVTAAMDGKCCLWDMRNSNPATVLYTNEFSSLTSVALNQTNCNYIVAGTEAGDLYLLDKREPSNFISVINCNNAVYRLSFNSSNQLAMCGDTNDVWIFKCEDEILHNAYCHAKHEGIVRGLAWLNDSLYSCGFDKRVLKHCL